MFWITKDDPQVQFKTFFLIDQIKFGIVGIPIHKLSPT
jgi:hypothetical protein